MAWRTSRPATSGSGPPAFCSFCLVLERSRVWLEMRAVHDDETAAGLIGLNTTAIKVGAFGFGAAVAAIAGGLFAHHHVYIEPGNFGFERSIDFVLAVILGGSTVRSGALVGAALLVLLPEYLRFLADWRFAAFGALLVGDAAGAPPGPSRPRASFAPVSQAARMTAMSEPLQARPREQDVRRRPRADGYLASMSRRPDRRRHRPERRRQDRPFQRHHRRATAPTHGEVSARRPRRSRG